MSNNAITTTISRTVDNNGNETFLNIEDGVKAIITSGGGWYKVQMICMDSEEVLQVDTCASIQAAQRRAIIFTLGIQL
jgi:hypothetical protein